MNMPNTISSSRRVRGASVVTILVAIAIIVGIAAAAWFLILRPHRQTVLTNQKVLQASHRAVKKSAPPPVNVAAMSTSELLSEASKAIQDQRLLAPKGNNAFEFYLKVLQRQPDNQVAKDALRETFPFAANAAEQVINRGDFAEAQREIGLLAKASPDNYTLTILRSKLNARRKVKAQHKQAEKLAKQQKKKAAAAAAQARQQALLAKQQAAKQAAQKKAVAKAAAQQKQEQLAQQPPHKAKPATPKVVIKNAVRVKYVQPRYPPAAARMRRQGWVIVQYTVGTDGQVHDAHVVSANPHHVFDRVALRAVSEWEYKPATRNGKPMAVTMRKRIRFTLNGS